MLSSICCIFINLKMDCELDGFSGLRIDAVPQTVPENINENICKQNIRIQSLLRDFSKEDYKSAFFLLMDFVKLDEFLRLTKEDETFLKNAFIKLFYDHFNDDMLLVELLGTMKMFKKLRSLDTCWHLYKNLERSFCYINSFWKMLYSLCEELTDEDFENLKRENVPSNYKDQILSAEDWFCWLLQNELFTMRDLSNLERLFSNYPRCLTKIKSYKDFDTYQIKTPTALSHCGIALIFNFENFTKKELKKRENSDKDVHSLEELWEHFGFKVHIHTDLSYSEMLKTIEYYASENHSKYDVFVCCILSHGLSNGVFSYDGVLMSIPELFTPFLNFCPTLNNKPKLFFIQACQGRNILQPSGQIIPIENDNTNIPKFPNYRVPPIRRDSLVVNSSIDGFVSFRDIDGTWFIQSLCKQIMQYGEYSSIEEIMIKVNEDVSKKSTAFDTSGQRNAIQISFHSSTLRKKLILKKKIS